MSFTRACLSASVRPSLSFVCLCATFSPVNNISCPLCVALECDNSCRCRLPLCPVDSPLTRHATAPRTSLRWNDNYIRRRRRATFTLACRNLPAASLVLLLPLLLQACPGCLLSPCGFFVQNCAHVLRNFSCVSMRRHRHCLCCFACNKITVSVSRTQLRLFLLLLPLWLLFCPLITNAMATTTKSKTQFSAFAYIFVTMSTSFWNHCPAHGTITHSAVHLHRNTSVENEATLLC